ncbi:MAG: response regulator [Methyloceanibacter sp.]
MSGFRAAAGQVTAPLPLRAAKVPLSILVAEDDLVTQDLLKFLLTQRGHRVDVVADGEKALQALREQHYAIVLMDFHLPKRDGLYVVSTFKSSGGDAKGSRFIGITGDVEGFMKHPDNWHTFDLVIAKPIDIVHLCGVVENFERYMAWRNREAGGSVTEPTPVMLPEEGARPPRPPAEERRSPEKRMRIARGTTQITLGNGQIFDCKVINLSLTGAALQLDVQPAIGERVRVGRTEGRVVRHTRDGIAVEFAKAAS